MNQILDFGKWKIYPLKRMIFAFRWNVRISMIQIIQSTILIHVMINLCSSLRWYLTDPYRNLIQLLVKRAWIQFLILENERYTRWNAWYLPSFEICEKFIDSNNPIDDNKSRDDKPLFQFEMHFDWSLQEFDTTAG